MKKMRRAAAIVLIASMVVACAGCSAKSKASLGEDGARRARVDDGKIYIIDDKVPLAANLGDPALLAEAEEALRLVNEQRAAEGLAPLSYSADLASAAYVRAEELTELFSHTRPGGEDWYTVNANIMFGENLAEFYNSAAEVVDGWMNSPAHRENIMDPEFLTCGIAIYNDGGDWYWAQEFGY